MRFPGQYYQAETGLNQNYFRDYDPLTGKYVESDPIGLAAGVNTYAYVKNRPSVLTDRFGLQPGVDTAVDKAIELLKKVCKKEDETCQQYQERIYRLCVTGPLYLNGVACKLVSEHFAEACIEDPQGVTCKKRFACAENSSGGPVL